MADQLASPADLASLLQTDLDTASATLAIEVATAVVQAAVDGQRIIRATTTETIFGGIGQLMRLTQQPLVSVTSVTFNGVLLTQGTASGNWSQTANGIWCNLGWSGYSGLNGPGWGDWIYATGPVSTVVVYTAGYDPAGSASDKQTLQLARGACLSLARGLMTNPTGVVSEKIDDYAVAYAAASSALEASPSLKALLRKVYGSKARMINVT